MDEKARIKRIMEIEGLNSSQFASEVGIPPSTISHIFNGRNKLSSAVTQKILKRFRTVSPEWLFSGVGTMYRQETNSQTRDLFSFDKENVSEPNTSITKTPQNFEPERNADEKKVETFQKTIPQIPIIPPIVEKPPRRIKRIIVYFDDNSFQEFIED